jgi:hypothetical protein
MADIRNSEVGGTLCPLHIGSWNYVQQYSASVEVTGYVKCVSQHGGYIRNMVVAVPSVYLAFV